MELQIRKLNKLNEALLISASLPDKLKLITDSIVDIFEADFARIWINKRGDLCDSECIHAESTDPLHACTSRQLCLHLISSSGRYTHIDGVGHRRIPFNAYKIGKIAAGKENRFIVNDIEKDTSIHDQEWARSGNLVSFAGFRLLSDKANPIGVLALFSQNQVSVEDANLLEGLANSAAQVIQTCHAEDALFSMINAFKESAFLMDVEGIVITANQEVSSRFNRSPSEIIGTNIFDFIPAETAISRKEKIREVIQTGQPIRFEDKREDLILSNSIYPVFETDGTVSRVAVFSYDVTEQKKVMEALKTRENQQAVVAELGQKALGKIELQQFMDDTVILVGQTLGVEFCKVLELLPAGNELLLRSGVGWKEGLVGKGTVSTELHSQAGYTLLNSEPVIVKDLRTETRFSGPALLHDHGVISGISVIIGELDRPYGVLGAHCTEYRQFTLDDANFLQSVANILAEVIERNRADEALKRSEKQYRTLITRMLNGFALHEIITDQNGIPIDYRFLEVNHAFEEITGLKKSEILGRTVLEVLPQTEQYWIEMYGGVALTEEPTRFENYSNALGEYFEVHAYSPQKGQFATVFSNITQRKRTETEREKLISDLEDALTQVKMLSGLLPICASCKKIRDDKGYWNQIETYIEHHSEAQFSHGICGECAEKLYGDKEWFNKSRDRNSKAD